MSDGDLIQIFYRYNTPDGRGTVEVSRLTYSTSGAVLINLDVDGFVGQPTDPEELHRHLGAAIAVRDQLTS
jgi:hypothetical protein